MHLAEGAAHEAAFLRRHEDRLARKRRATDDDAIIELHRQVEERQMRRELALLGAENFREAADVDQGCETLPGRRLKPAQGFVACAAHTSASSIRRRP